MAAQVREALEGMAARLAAEHMTSHELDQLGELLVQHAALPALAAGEAYLQQPGDEDFHFSTLRGARSERLEQLLFDQVYYQVRIHRVRSSTRPGRARAAFDEHKTMLAALQAHNPDDAEITMCRHVRNARFSAQAAMTDSSAPPRQVQRKTA